MPILSPAFSPKNTQTEIPIRSKIKSDIGSNKQVDLKVGDLKVGGRNERSWIKVNDSKELELDDPKDLKMMFSKS